MLLKGEGSSCLLLKSKYTGQVGGKEICFISNVRYWGRGVYVQRPAPCYCQSVHQELLKAEDGGYVQKQYRQL